MSDELNFSVRTGILVGGALIMLLACADRARRMTQIELPSPRIHAASFAENLRAAPPVAASDRPVFTDVSTEWGLAFEHDSDAHGAFRLPELVGPGCGLFDADGDGDLDVFVAGGGALDGPGQACRLFRNERRGVAVSFRDVSEEAGVTLSGPAYGVTCADVDNDGDVDVYVTRLGANGLLVNQGAGTFVEEGVLRGVADERFGTSATFLDFDRDGWLDLYVTNYVDWSSAHEKACYGVGGERDYCSPLVYDAPARDTFYRNLGDGRFEDVTERVGIAAARGNGLGVVAVDADDDGWVDILVANDQTPGMLWRNLEGRGFEDVALLSGTAYDGRGVAIAGMGIAVEDLDGDRDFDFIITNIREQSHLALMNEDGIFVDRSAPLGLTAFSIPATGFGIVLFDQDHDGALDAYVANGHVTRGPAEDTTRPFAQTDHFARLVEGRFVDATGASATGLLDVSRSVAKGDVDGDGDLDLLVTSSGGPVRVLRNDVPTDGHWLAVDVRDAAAGGRAALGAIVTIEADGHTQVRAIRPHESYLATSASMAHFGLGASRRVDRVTVRWPDGRERVVAAVPADQVIQIDEGTSP